MGYDLRIINSLQQIGRRSYWHRAWIRQEIILARNVQVHCGAISCDWKAFVAVFRNADCIDVMRRACSIPKTHDGDREAKPWHESYLQSVNALLDIDSEREELIGRQEKRPYLFFRALMRFGLAQATDLRDRVYALLSLYVDTTDPSALQADYTMSCKQLFFAVLGFYRIKSQCACAELGGHLVQVLELDVGDMTPLILGTQAIIDEANQITEPISTNQCLMLQFLKDFRDAVEYAKPQIDWTSDCGLILSGIAIPNGCRQLRYKNLGAPMSCVDWSKLSSVYYDDTEGEVEWEQVPETLLANIFSANLRRRSKFLEAFKERRVELESLPEALASTMVKEDDYTGHTILRLATSPARVDIKKASGITVRHLGICSYTNTWEGLSLKHPTFKVLWYQQL
ncbi:hypothetical protein PG988_000244 [Apiospora saccharicola]